MSVLRTSFSYGTTTALSTSWTTIELGEHNDEASAVPMPRKNSVGSKLGISVATRDAANQADGTFDWYLTEDSAGLIPITTPVEGDFANGKAAATVGIWVEDLSDYPLVQSAGSTAGKAYLHIKLNAGTTGVVKAWLRRRDT